MAKRGKKYRDMMKDFKDKEYSLEEAIKTAKSKSYSKFPGSLELHLAIFVPKEKDPKSIKGSFALPNPTETKESRIIVFCEKEDQEKAKKAGAVEAGLDELIKKIQDGWMDFDVALAFPKVMPKIAILGKNLGPKGLMPNPKTGTIIENVDTAIAEFKKGKTKFVCDESGVIHIVAGKIDTDDSKVKENVMAIIRTVSETIGKSPSALLKSLVISPTMGPGVRVELKDVTGE